jgi:UDP-glucose 4-epimerase
VPRWVRAALTGQPIVLYWQGQQYRDYVYVDDIARAHMQVLGREGLHVYNLGSGRGILMRDVVSALQELVDGPLAITDGGQRAGDPMRLVADVSRIKRNIGWQPEMGLREGLLRTIRFYESHRHLWDAPQLSDRRAA